MSRFNEIVKLPYKKDFGQKLVIQNFKKTYGFSKLIKSVERFSKITVNVKAQYGPCKLNPQMTIWHTLYLITNRSRPR